MLTKTLGGIGLFLLGMTLLTDGLKSVAGDALRRTLGRLTGGRFSALMTGAAVTAIVQSSSATTLATIGFVSAGLLSFPQAVGVVFGANLGTTSTSWIVSLLGLKFSVSSFALPLVGVGALLKLLTRERLSQVGLALAGFGLIFVGIDFLQAGLLSVGDRFRLTDLDTKGMSGRLLLVLIGAVMTVVLQSSSAASATTLAAVSAGTIDLTQAAALVIGQNIGTTVTAAVASVGASVPAKRTALAHVLFNLLTGVVAFAILPVFVRVVDALSESFGATNDAVSLAAFHTAFNLLGVVLLLPLVVRFAGLVERMVPDRTPTLTRHLDRSVSSLPSVAVEAARRALRDVTTIVCTMLEGLIEGRTRIVDRAAQADHALRDVRRFLAQVRSEPESSATRQAHLSALHAIDHLERLLSLGRETAAAGHAPRPPALAELQARVLGVLATSKGSFREGAGGGIVERLAPLVSEIEALRADARSRILEETANGLVDPDAALARLDAVRRLDSVARHLQRLAYHLSDHGPVDRPGLDGAPIAPAQASAPGPTVGAKVSASEAPPGPAPRGPGGDSGQRP